jgi:hypothetical protein
VLPFRLRLVRQNTPARETGSKALMLDNIAQLVNECAEICRLGNAAAGVDASSKTLIQRFSDSHYTLSLQVHELEFLIN